MRRVKQHAAVRSGWPARRMNWLRMLPDYFEQSVSRIAQVAQDLARDWGTLMQLPGFAGGRLQDLGVSLGSTVERVIQTNLHAMQELFRTAGPMAMVELQQRFVRDYLDALLQGSTAIIQEPFANPRNRRWNRWSSG